MIKDILENSGLYYSISENLAKGFEWLKNNDLQNMPDGKYEINGEKIYANIQTYITKDEAPFEKHNKYIDIQYIIDGQEKIGVTNYSNCSTVEEYDPSRDISFLSCTKTSSMEVLEKGEFLVLFPNDAHQPSLKLEKNTSVKKVVVKVLN